MRNRKSKVKGPRVVWGDWDKETVRHDWDDTPLGEVKLWAYRACFWFKLEGFVILRSSMKEYVVKKKGKVFYRYLKGSYHVVFDKPVKWSMNVHIMDWAALESGNENLKKWAIMQGIKESSTLRVSVKGKKPAPKIVFRFGSQDRQVKKFLETRRFLLDFLKSSDSSESSAEEEDSLKRIAKGG